MANARRLLVATTNQGKLREVRAYLTAPGIEPPIHLVSLRDVPAVAEVVEDAPSFQGNAVKKAVEYARATGLPALADDSGLCVDALDGEPGVGSALYGGPGLDDPARCRLLLDRLKDVPPDSRGARFECALALATPAGLLATFAGRVEGTIGREPRGSNGFGYDPIFDYLPAGKRFAEMATEEKSAVSHRGRALAQLRAWLEANPGAI